MLFFSTYTFRSFISTTLTVSPFLISPVRDSAFHISPSSITTPTGLSVSIAIPVLPQSFSAGNYSSLSLWPDPHHKRKNRVVTSVAEKYRLWKFLPVPVRRGTYKHHGADREGNNAPDGQQTVTHNFSSRIKRITANTIRATCIVHREGMHGVKCSIRLITPTIPGSIAPGLYNSNIMPYMPSNSKI